jgi:hypothetical protein
MAESTAAGHGDEHALAPELDIRVAHPAGRPG